MVFLFLLHLVFPGFSFSMSENRWADRCSAGDCSTRERRSHYWYLGKLTSWVVGMGWSRRGLIPYWRKRSCQGEICLTLKNRPFCINFFFFFVNFFRSFTLSRNMIRQTTTTLIVKWRRPLIPKLNAFVRLKLLVLHWMDWRWAPKAHPTTRHLHHRQAPCTRTIAHRVSIRVQQHSLDASTSLYFSRLRPLHKRNSAAQNWRTIRNAPTGKLERSWK